MRDKHGIIIPWEEEIFPFLWRERFPGIEGFHLEIGFGKGEFLLHLARIFPRSVVLGIDISSRSLLEAYKRIKKEGRDNVFLLRGEGRFLLKNFFPSFFLSGIYINFPDPWPKERHASRRLIKEDFIRIVSQKLRRGGILSIKTDWDSYAEDIERILLRFPEFKKSSPPEDMLNYSTKYERKALKEGREIHWFLMEKIRDIRYSLNRYVRVYPMPHVVFEGKIVPEEVAEKFSLNQVERGNIKIRFSSPFLSPRERKVLLPFILIEPDISQELAILIAPHGKDWIIKISSLGKPLVTEGVKEAVKSVWEWLLQSYPLKVVSSTL